MAVALAVWYWGMAVSGQFEKSTTFDEIAHLTAGYSYWLTGDYRLNPENGVLPQRWAALPLLLGDYRFPSLDQPAWRKANVWELGDQFFHRLGNPLDSMLLCGRAMIALAGSALGLVIYAWSRSLFGASGGMLSLVLYVLSPGMLAHGSLITSDLMLTLTLTASMWCCWLMLHRTTVLTVLRSAAMMALLFVSKMSAVLVVPMSLALLGLRLAAQRRETRMGGPAPGTLAPLTPAAVAGVVAVHVALIGLVIWAFFGFRYSIFGPQRHPDDRTVYAWQVLLAEAGPVGPVIELARTHRLLPEAYLYGFASTLYGSRQRLTFLNGEHGLTGWWYFFPYVVLVKTPLPVFLVLGFAAWGAVRLARSGSRTEGPSTGHSLARGLYATAPLWVLLVVYWAVALGSNLNIGHRHILPTYPALFVLAGSAARWFTRLRHKAASVALALCLLWMAIESLSIRPHYLAYFNQLVGGPSHAYRHLVDSSLDWGQDLPGLKRWLDRQGLGEHSATPVYLSYFGTGDPAYYGIAARPLPSYVPRGVRAIPPLTGGVYCISATMLQAVYVEFGGRWTYDYERLYRTVTADVARYHRTKGDQAARRRLEQEKGADFWAVRFRQYEQLRFARLASYLRQREPDDHVGYSILIYRLSNEQVQDALAGPLAELLGPVNSGREAEPKT